MTTLWSRVRRVAGLYLSYRASGAWLFFVTLGTLVVGEAWRTYFARESFVDSPLSHPAAPWLVMSFVAFLFISVSIAVTSARSSRPPHE